VQETAGLCRARDVMRCPAAAFTAQGHVGIRRGWHLVWIALDRSGTGGTTERRSSTIVADEEKGLSRIVRVRTWLAHELSSCNGRDAARLASCRVTCDGASRRSAVKIRERIFVGVSLAFLTACGPHAHIPLRPTNLPGALAPSDSGVVLARRLAPVLYLQPDETFPLARAVAVLHPEKRLIAYHLLWRDDVHGAWIPFTVPTDEEILWVGYDETYAPTDLWTYWHGTVLHTAWPKSQVKVDVQWGKHGSLPRNVRQSDLPRQKSLNFFYAMTIVGEPDILLGDIFRKGPICFCRSYRRYREFTRPILLAERIDSVVRTEDPRPVLKAIFGSHYSDKPNWP